MGGGGGWGVGPPLGAPTRYHSRPARGQTARSQRATEASLFSRFSASVAVGHDWSGRSRGDQPTDVLSVRVVICVVFGVLRVACLVFSYAARERDPIAETAPHTSRMSDPVESPTYLEYLRACIVRVYAL